MEKKAHNMVFGRFGVGKDIKKGLIVRFLAPVEERCSKKLTIVAVEEERFNIDK